MLLNFQENVVLTLPKRLLMAFSGTLQSRSVTSADSTGRTYHVHGKYFIFASLRILPRMHSKDFAPFFARTRKWYGIQLRQDYSNQRLLRQITVDRSEKEDYGSVQIVSLKN